MLRGGWADTPKNEVDNSLISYLETHEVDNYEEFNEVIQLFSPESINSDDVNTTDISYFCIDIDYENMLVTTILVSEMNNSRAHGAGKSVSKSYYSSSGFKIFTVNVEGTFSYSSGSCSTLSASGSYTRSTLSLWTSTPTITSGNITTRKAYAKISGTATSGSSSVSYSLTLTCDDSGTFSSY